MKKKNNNELSSAFWIILLVICIILVIFIAACFAIYSNRSDTIVEKEELGGNIVLNYTNNITGLKLSNISPVSDFDGINNNEYDNYFDFSINVELDNATLIEYEISAIKNEKISNISDDDIRIYLEKEKSGTYEKVFGPDKYIPLENVSELGSSEKSMILYSEKIKKNTTDNYRLRVWLSDSSELKMGDYSIEIVVNGVAK